MAVSLGASVTINVTAAGKGRCYTKVIVCNFTGGTITFTGDHIYWNGGTDAPTTSSHSVIVLTSADVSVWGTVITSN